MSAPIQLRRDIRQQRRQLTCRQRKSAENAVLQRAIRFAPIRYSKHIGIYLDAFGEVPTRKLIAALLTYKKIVYLPMVIANASPLKWYPVRNIASLNRLAHHPLGMQQPMRRGLAVQKLDCLLLPLVLFDDAGRRVGMGGGYYDRTLALAPQRPRRVGLAYDFQKSPHPLAQQKWDQNLDAVITPARLYRFNRLK